MKTILVTGVAGFIGMQTAKSLLERGDKVVGLDNLNAYYDPALKHARLTELHSHAQAKNFEFLPADLADTETTVQIFRKYKFDGVIHLAAQAGVRYSLENPQAYVDSNLTGFINVLESIRKNPIVHLVYASSSSVYGGNKKTPFSESDKVDYPVSLYAATKKANELMAHTYSHLFGIPSTGLRFFTVYGPWGRPDMAYFSFTKAILNRQPIKVFNFGKMQRDFTYIDDIVKGIIRILDCPPRENLSCDDFAFEKMAPHRILNIGNHRPESLMEFICIIEECVGLKALVDLQPMQPGDVPTTYAQIDALRELVGFAPETPLREGIGKFVQWYRSYYRI